MVIIAVIVLGWIVVTINQNNQQENVSAVASATDDTPSPFGALVQNVTAGISNVKTSIAAQNPFVATSSATSTQPVSVATTTPPSTFDQVIITDSPSQ